MSYPACPYDPTVTEFTDDTRCPVTKGTLYTWKHATYGTWVVKVVKFLDAVTYAAGQSCTPAAAGGTSVTNDRAGGSSLAVIARGGGLCLMANTTAKIGFVLVQGYYPTGKTSGADDIAAGESLILHATTDGTVDGVAANAMTTASCGTAEAADVDADDTVAGYFNFL